MSAKPVVRVKAYGHGEWRHYGWRCDGCESEGGAPTGTRLEDSIARHAARCPWAARLASETGRALAQAQGVLE